QTPEAAYESNARSWSREPDMLMVVTWDHGLKSAFGLAKSELQLWNVGTCQSRFVSRTNGHVSADLTPAGTYILTKPDPLSSAEPVSPKLWNAASGNVHLDLKPIGCRRENCGRENAAL